MLSFDKMRLLHELPYGLLSRLTQHPYRSFSASEHCGWLQSISVSKKRDLEARLEHPT